MPWYYYLPTGLIFCFAAASAAMFLPLRIFMDYLRENNEDRVSVAIRIYRFGFKLKLFRNGESKAGSFLTVGTRDFRIPVFRRVDANLESAAAVMNRYELGLPVARRLLNRKKIKLGLATLKVLAPELKKTNWKSFDLEVIYGLEDPSLVGLTYGGSWAIGGALAGLLCRLFLFDTAPRFKFTPRFDRAGFRIRWEGELAMPLFRGLRLLLITRKIWRCG